MSTLELNKFAGAMLLALLVIQITSTLGDALVRPRAHGPAQVAVAPTERAPAREEKVEPIAPLLASADAKAGEAAFKKCVACHTVDKGGANKIGPNLYGVIGRPVASHGGFSYSQAMKGKGGEWTYEELSRYLSAPSRYIPGNKMAFVGLPKSKERADLLAYLRTRADSPPPLPPVEAPAQ
jgi:cytochrome c